jgi:hypothetical protein
MDGTENFAPLVSSLALREFIFEFIVLFCDIPTIIFLYIYSSHPSGVLLAGWISFPSHVSGVESSGVEGNTHDRRLQSVRREREKQTAYHHFQL